MKLFDTHCHFERAEAAEIAAILARAKAAGVEKLMAVGGSEELNRSAQVAVGAVGGGRCGIGAVSSVGTVGAGGGGEVPQVICALGYDREQVSATNRPAVGSCRALGEIGLDYHYSPETREAQRKLFAAQLEEARQRDLPVVIHTREADEDTLALLKEIPSRGIIHCYTGTPEAAKRFLDLGFFISFSGIVTFRAADNVRDSVRVVPDDRILIETDAPFLAPVPMRGKPNEPAFLRYTCEFLADFRQMPAEDFAELTFTNAERILG